MSQGKLCHFWRFRVGNYRIISQIKDEEVTILVLAIGHLCISFYHKEEKDISIDTNTQRAAILQK